MCVCALYSCAYEYVIEIKIGTLLRSRDSINWRVSMKYYCNRSNWWNNSVEHFNSSEYFGMARKKKWNAETKTTEKFGRSFSIKWHHEPCRAPELLISMKESMAKMAKIQDIKLNTKERREKNKRKPKRMNERGKKNNVQVYLSFNATALHVFLIRFARKHKYT